MTASGAATHWHLERFFPSFVHSICTIGVDENYVLVSDFNPDYRTSLYRVRFGAHEMIAELPPQIEDIKLVAGSRGCLHAFSKEHYFSIALETNQVHVHALQGILNIAVLDDEVIVQCREKFYRIGAFGADRPIACELQDVVALFSKHSDVLFVLSDEVARTSSKFLTSLKERSCQSAVAVPIPVQPEEQFSQPMLRYWISSTGPQTIVVEPNKGLGDVAPLIACFRGGGGFIVGYRAAHNVVRFITAQDDRKVTFPEFVRITEIICVSASEILVLGKCRDSRDGLVDTIFALAVKEPFAPPKILMRAQIYRISLSFCRRYLTVVSRDASTDEVILVAHDLGLPPTCSSVDLKRNSIDAICLRSARGILGIDAATSMRDSAATISVAYITGIDRAIGSGFQTKVYRHLIEAHLSELRHHGIDVHVLPSPEYWEMLHEKETGTDAIDRQADLLRDLACGKKLVVMGASIACLYILSQIKSLPQVSAVLLNPVFTTKTPRLAPYRSVLGHYFEASERRALFKQVYNRLLIIHGRKDGVAPFSHSVELSLMRRKLIQSKFYDDEDHVFTRFSNWQDAFRASLEFIKE